MEYSFYDPINTKIMEYSFYDHMGLMVATILIGGGVAIYMVLMRANEWFYLRNLGEKRHSLPPGDMGWPLIGNMLSFLQAFKYGDPDSFISNLHSKYCDARIYKSFMFGSPSIILTTAEACKQALMDEEKFGPGWPASVVRVLGKRGLHGISNEEHRRQRRLTSASLSGHEAMSMYLEYIKDIVSVSLNELCERERPIELLTEMRRIAFKIIMYIILGTENSPMLEAMEEQYTLLAHGLKAMSINLPGFAFRKALLARKKLVKVFLALVVEERAKLETINQLQRKKFMVHWLMETEDEDGRRLKDDEIVDLIIIYLLAGHESFAHASTWAIIHLHEHPQYLHKAKEEQQEILNKRLSSDKKGLNLAEIKQMEYLAKVIDETFRVANISFTFFRETREEVKINGYTIPKGWKVLPWIRGVHMDPETYQNPKEFNPSRWDNQTSKVGARPFLPFGAGSRLCPGMNLAKLEMTVFLHYFLLNFKLERLTPGCKVAYLPITHPMDNCIAKIKKL